MSREMILETVLSTLLAECRLFIITVDERQSSVARFAGGRAREYDIRRDNSPALPKRLCVQFRRFCLQDLYSGCNFYSSCSLSLATVMTSAFPVLFAHLFREDHPSFIGDRSSSDKEFEESLFMIISYRFSGNIEYRIKYISLSSLLI